MFIQKPIWWLQCFHGHNRSALNPYGVQDFWIDDANAKNTLDRVISEAVTAGADTLLLNRPIGTSGYTHVSAGGTDLITESRKEIYREANTQINIMPFIGSSIHSTSNLIGYPHPQSELVFSHDGKQWRAALGAWISMGIQNFAFDASSKSDRSKLFTDAYPILKSQGINIIGEAIPRTSAAVPNYPVVEKMPWLATHAYFEQSGMNNAGVKFTTPVYVWFDWANSKYGSRADRIRLVLKYLTRGFSVITNDPDMFEIAMRFYEAHKK